MCKPIFTVISILLFSGVSFCQPESNQKVFTQDIDNFWIAFDSIQTTQDSLKQIHFIQTLYIDKGTEGLKAFMKARDYSASLWVQLIHQYPKFWNSTRPNTLMVKAKAPEIENSIEALRKLYPALKDAKMYFTIGGLRSGGTTMGNMVLVGAEIATGNAATDVSEFSGPWLAQVFKEQTAENIIPLNIHEYVHTQQRGESTHLLAQAIREGACDFITELVMGTPLQNSYSKFGREHEAALKEKFKGEMFTTSYNKWLYNASSAETMADLGYFMGYAICRSYYRQARNKKKAVKDIIELNYSDARAVENFLKQSKYYTEPIDKKQLLQTYREKQPVLLMIEPFRNGDTTVDASLNEVTLVFSQPMAKGYSLEYSERGKDVSPITGIAGYSEDKKRFTIRIQLQPDHDYEFVVTNRSFRSLDGYPLLKDYTIQFKTRP